MTVTGPEETDDTETGVVQRSPESLFGKIIDGFQIGTFIDKGAMGAVFKARQLATGRDVAFKIMFPKSEMTDEEAWNERVQRFRDEPKRNAKVRSDYIMEVFHAGEFQGRPYLAIEYADRGTILQYWEALDGPVKRLSHADATRFLMQSAIGLLACERAHIVHRDIKPSNLLLKTSRDDPTQVDIKIGDFGIAKDKNADKTAGDSPRTPRYASPEQWNREPVDHRSDMYSLGATFYHLVTGRPAADGTEAAIRTFVTSCPYLDPELPAARVDKSLAAVIRKLTAKYPSDRYKSFEDVVEDLRKIQAGLPVKTKVPKNPDPQPWVKPAGVVAAGLLLVAGTWYMRERMFPKGVTRQEIEQRYAVLDRLPASRPSSAGSTSSRLARAYMAWTQSDEFIRSMLAEKNDALRGLGTDDIVPPTLANKLRSPHELKAAVDQLEAHIKLFDLCLQADKIVDQALLETARENRRGMSTDAARRALESAKNQMSSEVRERYYKDFSEALDLRAKEIDEDERALRWKGLKDRLSNLSKLSEDSQTQELERLRTDLETLLADARRENCSELILTIENDCAVTKDCIALSHIADQIVLPGDTKEPTEALVLLGNTLDRISDFATNRGSAPSNDIRGRLRMKRALKLSTSWVEAVKLIHTQLGEVALATVDWKDRSKAEQACHQLADRIEKGSRAMLTPEQISELTDLLRKSLPVSSRNPATPEAVLSPREVLLASIPVEDRPKWERVLDAGIWPLDYAIPSGLVPLVQDRDRFGFKKRFYELNNERRPVPMLLVQPDHQPPFLMDVRALTYGECKAAAVGKALVLMDPNYYDEQARTRPQDDYLWMPIRKVTKDAVLALAKSYDSRLDLPTADHYIATGVRISVFDNGEILNEGGVFLGGRKQDPAPPRNPAFPVPYSARFVLILEKMAR